MLRQRVFTAIALLALLAVVIGSESLLAFRVTLAVFLQLRFGKACACYRCALHCLQPQWLVSGY